MALAAREFYRSLMTSMHDKSCPCYSEKAGHTSVSTDLDWILKEAVLLSRAHNDAPVDIRQFGKWDGRYFGLLRYPTEHWLRNRKYILGGDNDTSTRVAVVTAPAKDD